MTKDYRSIFWKSWGIKEYLSSVDCFGLNVPVSVSLALLLLAKLVWQRMSAVEDFVFTLGFVCKSVRWIGCLHRSDQTCIFPPLALQLQLLSLSLTLCVSLSSSLAWSQVVKNRLWHFVTWQSGSIMPPLSRAAIPPPAVCPSGAREWPPLDRLSPTCTGATLGSLPAFTSLDWI